MSFFSATRTSSSPNSYESDGEIPIMGPLPSIPHSSALLSGVFAKLTSTAIISSASELNAAAFAPPPLVSSRDEHTTVTFLCGLPLISSSARRSTAIPERSSSAPQDTLSPQSERKEELTTALSPGETSFSADCLFFAPISIRMSSISVAFRSLSPLARCGGVLAITPNTGSLP